VTTAAAQFSAVDVWSAVWVPVALTILYSESMVTWPAEPPVLPELSWVSAVNPAPTAVNSPALPSRAMPPITSSSACVVAAEVVADGVPLLPVAVPDASATGFAIRPENSFTLIALSIVAIVKETVIALPVVSAVVIVDEKTTTRTPLVPEPFVRSASRVYVFPFASAHVTTAADGSIATVTITVLPTGTPAAGVLTASVVPLVSLEFVPTFFTNADRTVGWDFNRGNCVGDGDPDFLGIEFGIHPFAQDSTLTSAPDYSSTTLMPVQFKNIQSASVTVDSLRIMLNEQAPNFLLGFRVWLSLHDPTTNPSPAVSDELVVLWGWAGRLACGQTATIVSGGKSYDLCQDDSAYGWQGVTWRYREFRLQSGPVTSFSGAFDIKSLLNWIIATDPVYSADHWVTRFEIGTELGDLTSGSANVKDVTFELNGDSRSITLAE